MQDNQILFEIKDLCKSFGDNLVLDHISTEIRKGEEKKRLLAQFDEVTEGLLSFGISRDSLIARLQRGGNRNA